MMEKAAPRTYLPIDGLAVYDKAVQELVFGADSPVIQEKRAITVQAMGGTGGLKLGADFLQALRAGCAASGSATRAGKTTARCSNRAGFQVNNYPYYDAATHGVEFRRHAGRPERHAARLHRRAARLLPQPDRRRSDQPNSGTRSSTSVSKRGLVPFLDMAYQGFGDGIAEDGAVVRRFAAAGGPLLRVEFVLQVVLAVRRARRRAEHRRRQRRRSSARAVAAEARDPHQLLEPADPWRPGRRHGAGNAGTAPAVGRRTGRHARAHPRNARRLLVDKLQANAPAHGLRLRA